MASSVLLFQCRFDGELGSCDVAERRAGLLSVVIPLPLSGGLSCLDEGREQRVVQAHVAEAAVEALDEGVFHGLAGSDVVLFYARLLTPSEDSHRCQFGAVVGDDCVWPAVPGDYGIQFAHDTGAGERRVGDERQALPCVVGDHGQDAEAPPIGELVVDKICRPVRVWFRLDRDRRPCALSRASGATLTHRQPYLLIEPIDAIDARSLAFAPEEDEQPSVIEVPALVGGIAQPCAKLRVRRATRAVSDHLPIRLDDAEGPTFQQAHHGLQMREGVAQHGGSYHFLTEAHASWLHPASARAGASSSWRSGPRAPPTAWPRKHPCRENWPSSCKGSPQRCHACRLGRRSSLRPHILQHDNDLFLSEQ